MKKKVVLGLIIVFLIIVFYMIFNKKEEVREDNNIKIEEIKDGFYNIINIENNEVIKENIPKEYVKFYIDNPNFEDTANDEFNFEPEYEYMK